MHCGNCEEEMCGRCEYLHSSQGMCPGRIKTKEETEWEKRNLEFNRGRLKKGMRVWTRDGEGDIIAIYEEKREVKVYIENWEQEDGKMVLQWEGYFLKGEAEVEVIDRREE